MLQLLNLPTDLIVDQIATRLRSTDKWRFRCTSTKVRRMILDWIPRPLYTDVDAFFVLLAFDHVDIPYDDPFVRNLMEVVQERGCFDYTGPFKRWVHTNRVCIDGGGFYVRLKPDLRVRIGWWETGLLVQVTKRGSRITRKCVSVKGMEVYKV